MLPNAVTVPQLRYNTSSTTFNHQILHNVYMAMNFDLYWQNSRKVTLFRKCESAVSQFNLATTEFTVRVVAMHTFVYSGHVEYDKNNDTMSATVNTAGPWSHGGSLEHNLEPGYSICKSNKLWLLTRVNMDNSYVLIYLCSWISKEAIFGPIQMLPV